MIYCVYAAAWLGSALYSIGGLLVCFVTQPPSNNLFVAVADYTTLLFCFDSTRHSYYRFHRRRKVGGRGICTDYVIVSKETSLGIAGIEYLSKIVCAIGAIAYL